MAGGGNVFEADHNGLKFMRYSDWRMGVLFAGFVIVMLIFDKIVHTIEHRLKDDPTRKGLRHAVKRFKTELLAVGVVSLLLVALTEPMTKICLPGGHHQSESALAHLTSGGAAHSTNATHTPSASAHTPTADSTHTPTADSTHPPPADATHTPSKSTHTPTPAPEPHTPAAEPHAPTTPAATKATPAPATAAHTPTEHRRQLLRRLTSSGASEGHGSDSCNHLFDEHTIHNAHLLLFLIAIVNIAYGVATLLIGVLSVEEFRKPPHRFCGLLRSNKQSLEEDVADDDYLKPLKHGLAKDIEKHGHSAAWRLCWAFKRQFSILGDERVVTKDLYVATRSCAFDFLNTIHFHVRHGGKVILAAGQHLPPPSLPCTRPSPTKPPTAAHPTATVTPAPAAADAKHSQDQQAPAGAEGTKHHLLPFLHHKKYDLKAAAGKLHRMHLQRHMDFVGLVRVAVEIVFTKETNSEWILPLLLAVLFAIPHTPVLLVALVSLQLLVNLALGIKMQCIMLHMAIRYQHKRRVWCRWVSAKDRALATVHNTNGTSRATEAPAEAPAEHAIVPIGAAHHEAATVEHFHRGITKDASTLFWFGWPDLVKLMMEVSYFTNSLVLALLLFVAWQGRKQEPRIFQETWRFWTFTLTVTAANFFHLSFMVMPAYALLTTTGRHVPLELIQAVRHPQSLQALYHIRTHASRNKKTATKAV